MFIKKSCQLGASASCRKTRWPSLLIFLNGWVRAMFLPSSCWLRMTFSPLGAFIDASKSQLQSLRWCSASPRQLVYNLRAFAGKGGACLQAYGYQVVRFSEKYLVVGLVAVGGSGLRLRASVREKTEWLAHQV